MLYVLIEAQRAWLDKVQRDSELTKREPRVTSEDKRGLETEQSALGVLRPPLTKEPVPPLFQSQVQDSEWFTLSPQERCAFSSREKNDLHRFAPWESQWFLSGEMAFAIGQIFEFFDREGGWVSKCGIPHIPIYLWFFYLSDWLGQKHPKTLGLQKVNSLHWRRGSW